MTSRSAISSSATSWKAHRGSVRFLRNLWIIGMPSEVRLQRIADRIRQELSDMLIRELSDPRLKLVNVTDVKVDKELAFADIYVSAVEGSARSEEILHGLES